MDAYRRCVILLAVSSICLPVTNCQLPDWFPQVGGLEEIGSMADVLMSMANIPFSFNDILQLPKGISQVCVDDLKYTASELVTAKTWSNVTNSWAVRMLDSTGKLPSGLLRGNLFWLGNFQQCLEVVAPEIYSSREKFIGEYCLVKLHFNNLPLQELIHMSVDMPVELQIGSCLPSTCSFKDKSILMNYTFGLFKDSVDVSIMEELCQTKRGKPMDTTTIVLTCIIASFGLIVVLATLVDVLLPNDSRSAAHSSMHIQLLGHFSAIRNLKAIFHIHENDSELNVINGLRVCSSYWILIGHTMSYTVAPYPWKNQVDVFVIMESFFYQPLAFACTYAVTTFFTISGFLVTYNFMKYCRERNQTPKILWFYLRRYLRLTPTLIIVLMFISGPWHHMLDGPMQPAIFEIATQPCRIQWWKSITYIQNILLGERDCLLDTWYLSADVQLYIMASIILYQLYKKPLLGLLLMGTIFSASTLLSTYIISANNTPTFLGRNTDIPKFRGYFGTVYVKTFYHAPCYIIGMATGYLYYFIRNNRIALNKRLITPAWACALTTQLVIVFGTYSYFNGSSTMGPWMNLMNGVLARPFWALGICWLILACASGHGGILNWILTRPFFTVMGRLTYCTFLTHHLVLSFYFVGQQDGLHFRTYSVLLSTISNFAISLMVAVVLTLLIETPSINILKQFQEKKTSAQPIAKYD